MKVWKFWPLGAGAALEKYQEPEPLGKNQEKIIRVLSPGLDLLPCYALINIKEIKINKVLRKIGKDIFNETLFNLFFFIWRYWSIFFITFMALQDYVKTWKNPIIHFMAPKAGFGGSEATQLLQNK